jgi:DNA-damage-inducible protein J
MKGETMPAVDVVRARIDTVLKKEATAVLSAMGLSVSDAIRLMLVRVVSDKALPFDVRIPNAETQAAMRDIQQGKGITRFDSVEALMANLNDDEN